MTTASQPPALVRFLRLVRFSHTVFALPFALGAALVAARGFPTLRITALILLCMVFARTAAMLFNRIVDWEIDKRNPRTRERHTLLSRAAAIVLCFLCSVGFVAASREINFPVLVLSPIALLIIFFYSLTKRFTSYSHFFLGLALSVAPVGAWLAIRGRFELPPLLLAGAVLFWVAGFDIIYATQDYEFDRREGLHSLVVRLGIDAGLRCAQILHWIMFSALALFGFTAQLACPYYLALIPIAGALVYEHSIARSRDLVSINKAFFNSNAFVGAVFLVGAALGAFFSRN